MATADATTTTAAETAAAAVNHDGSVMATADGIELTEIIEEHGGRISNLSANDVSRQRWQFGDGSAIIVVDGSGWYYGAPSTDRFCDDVRLFHDAACTDECTD